MKFVSYIFLLLILAYGCTVRYSFTGGVIPADAKTVSIGDFISTAPLAGPSVSQQFTNAMSAMLLSQTRLDVVDQMGDLMFDGTIVGYNIKAVAVQSDTEAAAKNRLTIRVKVIYTNTIEPDKSFEKEFSQFADYAFDENFQDIEDALVDEINQILVQDIFNASLGSW
jgi:hypothetical protein